MTVSTFRLYPHIQTGSADQDHQRWNAQGCAPAWAKVFAGIHCTEVKAATGGQTHTLLRCQELSENPYYLLSREHGGYFVRDAKARAGGTFDDVDALEFMNERTSFNDVFTLEVNNAAALGFVAACKAEGVRPVVHNAAFANPDPTLMHLLAPSIQAALDAGGYFGLHCYGPSDLFDGREYYVECYAAQLAALARAGVVVPPARVLITEFGHDTVSDPNYHGRSGAWRKLGLPVGQVQCEYEQYEAQLDRLGIAGAFMYNVFGTKPERPYELWPDLRDWYGMQLAQIIGAPQPLPPIGTPPQPPPAPDDLVVIARPYANLRSAPRIEPATDIGDVWPGAPVHMLERAGEWYRVEISGQAGGSELRVQGWMHRSVLGTA